MFGRLKQKPCVSWERKKKVVQETDEWWIVEPVREDFEKEESTAEFSPGRARGSEREGVRRIKSRERCMAEERAAGDRPANPHIYILLINPDYHFLIGLLRLPQNKVTLPNELNLQFTIGALFPPLVFSASRIGPVWEPPVCQWRVVSLHTS